MPTLSDYEKFFDSIGIGEKSRVISTVSDPSEIPKHGNDLPSEWLVFEFENGIAIWSGPEESAWLQTVCQIQPESVTVPTDAYGVTHLCCMPGRKLWFMAKESAGE